MAKKLFIALTVAAALVTLGFGLMLGQAELAEDAAAAEKISYIPINCRWDGQQIIVEGVFCNENPDRHVKRVDLMMAHAYDKQDNEIGTYIMNPEARRAFRLSPMVNYAYNLTLYPNPKAKLPEQLADGVQLSLFTNITTAPCPGDGCTWCYPPAKGK